MSASTARQAFRIYYLHPLLVGDFANWPAWLDHVAAMGFAQLLIPPPFETGESGDVFCSRSVDMLHPDFGDADLADLARACGERDLDLWLDLPLDEVAADANVRAEHPEWFRAVATAHDTPDPRWTPSESDTARWRLNDPAVADAALAWWTRQLAEWVDAGVRGFRCVHPQRLRAPAWRRLIDSVHASHPDVVFVAWTPGLTREELGGLRGAGFDATFSSANWWDFRSTWFVTESQRLADIAPSVACAEAPFDQRLGDGLGEANQLDRAYRRAVRFAATSPAGWLMPMGFEFAVHDALDPRRGDPLSPTALAARGGGDFDVSGFADFVSATNRELADAPHACGAPQVASGEAVTTVLSMDAVDARTATTARLVLVNVSLDREVVVSTAQALRGAAAHFAPYVDGHGEKLLAGGSLVLAPGEVVTLTAPRGSPVARKLSASAARGDLAEATRAPRIAIEAVTPAVDAGRFPVKAIVGDRVDVEADVFMDGHDVIAVRLKWRALDEKAWREEVMKPLGNDRYAASFTPQRIGRHEYAIEAWRDAFATYRHELSVKHEAGVPVALELEEGRLLVEAFAQNAGAGRARPLRLLARVLAADDDASRLEHLLDEATLTSMRAADPRPFATVSPALPLEVDRREAGFASWYELFPRSETSDPSRHGTFIDVIARLPAIRAMGFDVLYFPPIHPIGKAFRKGRNNSLSPAADDPGSPYAIGSPEGGHTDIHPALGTIDDFRRLRDEAHAHGLELALDFAIQCSPDHPWLKSHPEWFDWRPDGSLRYAENPPKKYQDIVNVDFYTEGAVPSLWQALCDVVLYWAGEGVRTFRVDNPHTKPFPFWEWMIARVKASYPDALFLSEAFTRPKPMYRLGKAGFSQSYTYFTWRHSKQEFVDYLTELTQGPPKDFFRPNFFVNTPDINPYFLQQSGRAGFLIRAALAATLSGLWGIYSGFELCEAAPVPGKEEYLDSEKYEIRPRDWRTPGNIVDEITRLNAIRREQPALHSHLGIRFLPANSDQVLFFAKRAPEGGDAVLVAINLDPHAAQAADLVLPLYDWGLADDAILDVRDLLNDVPVSWRGAHQHVWLGPGLPYAIWSVRLPGV
jgi:starch synthase (maltosyl-transferring)